MELDLESGELGAGEERLSNAGGCVGGGGGGGDAAVLSYRFDTCELAVVVGPSAEVRRLLRGVDSGVAGRAVAGREGPQRRPEKGCGAKLPNPHAIEPSSVQLSGSADDSGGGAGAAPSVGGGNPAPDAVRQAAAGATEAVTAAATAQSPARDEPSAGPQATPAPAEAAAGAGEAAVAAAARLPPGCRQLGGVLTGAAPGGGLELRLLLDASVLELFALSSGEALTTRVNPPLPLPPPSAAAVAAAAAMQTATAAQQPDVWGCGGPVAEVAGGVPAPSAAEPVEGVGAAAAVPGWRLSMRAVRAGAWPPPASGAMPAAAAEEEAVGAVGAVRVEWCRLWEMGSAWERG
ncbi:hypothetical protein GPECTOR_36g41 [Gonium pectorale]|uniref:Glycosyl hydrolase family 32 C-terminal domain-containing protein n=1 Tax=Gonium pectorale TaxID=33097 RepID=A0A150GBT6_GONPE|nr:hypothetical protein GPECTOR_36g41 [Gonium pectorale]|eukprot:KXZ47317.1 hypothetical protein GPECTOR_36g41 [Gonium pectorale]